MKGDRMPFNCTVNSHHQNKQNTIIGLRQSPGVNGERENNGERRSVEEPSSIPAALVRLTRSSFARRQR